MISENEVQRVQQEEAAELNQYSLRLWVVLSLVLSLATVVILSKNQLVHHRWVYMAVLIVPMALTLYFRSRIVLFGPFVYVGALLAMLGAAVFFGI